MADRTNPAAVSAELEQAAEPRDWESEIVSGPPVPSDPDWVVARKQEYADRVAQAGQAEHARITGLAQLELGHALAEDVERDLAQRAHAAGVDLSLPFGNVGLDDRPHFLTLVEGVERCGQDLEPWPCSTWREHISPRLEADGQGAAPVSAEQAAEDQRVEQAAALLGLEPAALARFRAEQAAGPGR